MPPLSPPCYPSPSVLQAVENWLPDCTGLLRKGAESSELGESPEETLPASSLLSYLSHLTSAVQFVTNMVRCTEKRNQACDPDSPLPVSVCVCVCERVSMYMYVLHVNTCTCSFISLSKI